MHVRVTSFVHKIAFMAFIGVAGLICKWSGPVQCQTLLTERQQGLNGGRRGSVVRDLSLDMFEFWFMCHDKR